MTSLNEKGYASFHSLNEYTHFKYSVTLCSSSKLYLKPNSVAFFFAKSLRHHYSEQ